MSEHNKRVWLDVFGCDEPSAMISGAVMALNEIEGISLVISGDVELLTKELKTRNCDMSRVELVEASQIVTNDDNPAEAIMKKRDATLFKSFLGLRTDKDAVGMVTAGSTGAALVGSAAFLGRLPGIVFPALASYIPTYSGQMAILVDCGANVDCKPEALKMFALLGSALAESIGRSEPKVALVSVGTEKGKGNAFSKEAFAILSDSNINFVGNMEARDAVSGKYDVMVCDGFTGNVLLKAVEGGALFVAKTFMTELKKVMPEDMYQAYAKKAFAATMGKIDMQSLGGAMILGVAKPVVKLHGSANEKSVPSGIRQLLELGAGGFEEKAKALTAL
ncbi:MAG: phosphate acyltransferase PlsX [Oscillospiraceae bacterium]|nr:phosphate acyltransferase PlsX [Oscillospiraceae bacterium]